MFCYLRMSLLQAQSTILEPPCSYGSPYWTKQTLAHFVAAIVLPLYEEGEVNFRCWMPLNHFFKNHCTFLHI